MNVTLWILLAAIARTAVSIRGVVLCTNNKMVDDVIAASHQVQLIFSSALNVTAAHCAELDDHNKDRLRGFGIDILDICEKSQSKFGMTRSQATARLRSGFCKAAAIVMSPYDEVMVVDLDVVWFKPPDHLFYSPAYRQTGSLFFRDKHGLGSQQYHDGDPGIHRI